MAVPLPDVYYRTDIKASPDWGVVLRAIDLMGLALANHNHVWTDEERSAFEQAVRAIGRLVEAGT